MRILFCPIADCRVLSPAVGCFYTDTARNAGDDVHIIGRIVRLGESIGLAVESCGDAAADIAPGTNVEVGTPIGILRHIEHADDRISKNSQNVEEYSIVSPADGFLIYTDRAGMPLYRRGDRLMPGCRIAVIEFMKLSVDIPFNGAGNAIFMSYEGISPRSVRAGEIIAHYRYI